MAGGRRRPRAAARAARPQRGRRLPRQPVRAQPGGERLRTGVPEGARLAEHLLGQHGRPDAEAGLRRADVRRDAQRAGARPRPLRAPARARGEPARVERQPDDLARRARADPRDPRARRQGRRRSTRAARAPPRRRTSTTRSCRAPTRTSCSGSCTRCSTRASPIPGRSREHCDGIEEVERLAADFAPERVAAHCGIEADEIRRIARELAAAPRGACYGRIGTCTQEFGTLASWLVDVVNVLTGNLDREGGAMFTKRGRRTAQLVGRAGLGQGRRARALAQPRARPARDASASSRSCASRRRSRRRATARCARSSRSRATRCVSTPQSERLDRALSQLDFMVSLDIYVNETTRHADVILPGPSPLARSHYDLALYQLAVRNVANYSPPVMEPEPDLEPEWRQLLRLTAIVTGQGADADIDALDDFVLDALIQRAVADPQSPLAGSDPAEVREAARRPPRPRPGARPLPPRRPVRAHARRARGEPARDRPRPARAADPRGPAHARRARSSSRRSRSSPTSSGCARRSSGAATATSC